MPENTLRVAARVARRIQAVTLVFLLISSVVTTTQAQTLTAVEIRDALRQLEALARREELRDRRPYLLAQLTVYYGVFASAYDEARRLYLELPRLADTISNETYRGYFIAGLERVNENAGPPGEKLILTADEQRISVLLADLQSAAKARQTAQVLRGLETTTFESHQVRDVLDSLRRALLDSGDLEAAHALLPRYPERSVYEHFERHMRDIRASVATARRDLTRRWIGEISAAIGDSEERHLPEAAAILVKLGLVEEALALGLNAKEDAARALTWSEVALTLMDAEPSRGTQMATDLLLGRVVGVTLGQLADVPVSFDHAVTERCRGPRKRTPSIDARWRYVRSGFTDCGYEPRDSAAMVLALSLFKRTSSQVAADALMRLERDARRQYHPVVSMDVDYSPACKGHQHSLDFVPPYLAAGADEIVRSYLSEIMRQCSMAPYDASQIAKHLTMLGGRRVVDERVAHERRLAPASTLIAPLLG